MTNNDQVHGHSVIERVAANPEGIQRQRLAELVYGEFGADVRFCTCSAENMTLDELLVFLAERNKVSFKGDLVYPGGSPACTHDHE